VTRRLRAALLFGFAILIAKLFVAGEMVKYMAPALDPLTGLTGLVLAAMAVMELRGARTVHAHGSGSAGIEQALTYALVVLPIALGLAVSPRALGAGALGGEDVASLLLAYAPGGTRTSAGPPAPARAVDDTAGLLAYLQQAGEGGVGQRVRATGLALRSEELGDGEFALLRYSIAHCVADARPVGLLVIASGEREIPVDRWVEVEGALAVRDRQGDRLVTITAERIAPIEEPRSPYLSAAY
jgi:uncharacterized repeat protein (TIGR03943 family)